MKLYCIVPMLSRFIARKAQALGVDVCPCRWRSSRRVNLRLSASSSKFSWKSKPPPSSNAMRTPRRRLLLAQLGWANARSSRTAAAMMMTVRGPGVVSTCLRLFCGEGDAGDEEGSRGGAEE